MLSRGRAAVHRSKTAPSNPLVPARICDEPHAREEAATPLTNHRSRRRTSDAVIHPTRDDVTNGAPQFLKRAALRLLNSPQVIVNFFGGDDSLSLGGHCFERLRGG
jgi:hypothetical protein